MVEPREIEPSMSDELLRQLRGATEMAIEAGWDDGEWRTLLDPIILLGVFNELIEHRDRAARRSPSQIEGGQ